VLAAGTIADIGQKLRVGEVLRVRILGDTDELEAARAWFEARDDVASAISDAPGQIEIGFRGDEAGAARLLADAVQARLAIASYSPATTDLQELFLQVTDRDDAQRAEATA
jgi:hypothetical protein